MKDVEAVAKDSRNEFHKYNYASDAAIITEVRKAMIAHKLVAVPSQVSCEREAVGDKGGGITTIQVKYTLIDAETGDCTEAVVYGQGQDTGDKGAYKAATGAEKYFFLKTFLIPTEDDPEKSNGQAKNAPAKRPQQKKAPEVKETPEMQNRATDMSDSFQQAQSVVELLEMAKQYKPGIAKMSSGLQSWLRQEFETCRKALERKAAGEDEPVEVEPEGSDVI